MTITSIENLYWKISQKMRTEPKEWELSQHIRKWHYLQPKILKHWVCEFSFLYVTQISHFYSMWDLN